jgi:hypothetical protein
MNTQDFQRVPDIVGDDPEDTALLRGMAQSARDYISSFAWCPEIKQVHLASGVGGLVAVFLFEFNTHIKGTDDKLWVIVGDLPSAYMVVEPNEAPQDALEKYCELMEDWIQAVRNSAKLDDVFPVAAEPSLENAELLEKRIAFLIAETIPGIVRTAR